MAELKEKKKKEKEILSTSSTKSLSLASREHNVQSVPSDRE
jgi:hypothetical protein